MYKSNLAQLGTAAKVWNSAAPITSRVACRSYASIAGRSSAGPNDEETSLSIATLDRERQGRERIVVLGSGWAGYNLAYHLDPKKFQTVVASPRSYFVFTPLLASTATGTLEFRTALEPVRSHRKNAPYYIQAWADDADFSRKTVTLEEATTNPRMGLAPTQSRFEGQSKEEVERHLLESRKQQRLFDLSYDRLVVAVGSYSQTFKTPGVREHALFLKDVGDARRIRQRILTCYEYAALPSTPEHIRRQLLNFVIVGGGPTGIEFSAELHDLVHEDLDRLYPHLKGLAKITVHDVAPHVLNMFDRKLSDYAIKTFRREGIDVRTESVVESIKPGLPSLSPESKSGSAHWQQTNAPIPGVTVQIKGQEPQGVGMVVWSTGLMANPFITRSLSQVQRFPENSTIFKGDKEQAKDLQWKLARNPQAGSVLTNDRMRIILEANQKANGQPLRAYMSDVFALGDCGTIENTSYPATAQVANQKAIWLAKRFNKGDLARSRFEYRDLGVMAYIGGWRAIFQSGGSNEPAKVSGRAAWILWRGAYFVKSISLRNKVLIPIYWLINWLFGRDISRF